MTPNRVGGRSPMEDDDFVCPLAECAEIGVQTDPEPPRCPRHRVSMITLSEKTRNLNR